MKMRDQDEKKQVDQDIQPLSVFLFLFITISAQALYFLYNGLC